MTLSLSALFGFHTYTNIIIFCLFCLFVLFQQIFNYMNKAIQRRGVKANGTMALQPVEAPSPVCQQTAKSIKEKYFYN